MLRDSIHGLWLELFFLILERKYQVDIAQGIRKDQLDLVGKEAWDLLTECSIKEDLPDKSGTAFYLGWGHCKITHEEVAKIVTEKLKKEGKYTKNINKNNIKRYYNVIRNKMRDCALEKLEMKLKKWPR